LREPGVADRFGHQNGSEAALGALFGHVNAVFGENLD